MVPLRKMLTEMMVHSYNCKQSFTALFLRMYRSKSIPYHQVTALKNATLTEVTLKRRFPANTHTQVHFHTRSTSVTQPSILWDVSHW